MQKVGNTAYVTTNVVVEYGFQRFQKKLMPKQLCVDKDD